MIIQILKLIHLPWVYFCREVESYSQIVASIGTCLSQLEVLMSWCPEDGLIPVFEHDPYEIYAQTSKINQYCFYGRHIGLQVFKKNSYDMNFL